MKDILQQIYENAKAQTLLFEQLLQRYENEPAPAPIPLPEIKPDPIQKELNPLPKEASYQKPLIITKGGTYTGNWQSTDSNTPAIDIQTKEPVIIENSNVRGAGYLIKCWYQDCDLTIRNTRGYGLTPTAYSGSMKPRRFAIINFFKNVVIENCYLESTAGIYVGDKYVGDNTTGQGLRIRYNQARNIDGRVHNGYYRSQFFQSNFRGQIKHMVIAWNEVVNEPGKSAVEDNINIYNTQGAEGSPIRIHDNYIQGAYPTDLNAKQYSGGGIITESTETGIGTAYLEAYDNQLVNIGNYSMGIAGGHHITYRNNRIVNSGEYDTGQRFPYWVSSMWAKQYYAAGETHSNTFEGNFIAVNTTWGKNDLRSADNTHAQSKGNTFQAEKVTKAQEKAEFETWQAKLKLNSIRLGVK